MMNRSTSIKSILWFTIGLFILSIGLVNGQSGIDLLSRVQQQRILLRWIPNTPEAWQAANQTGYTVTRTTLTSSNPTPSPTKTVTVNGIKPSDQAQWQPYLNPDSLQHASIYYLTVNDLTNFQRPPAIITDSLSGHATVTPQFTLDERYVYVTIAANSRFAAAVKAGLGYIDTDVIPGETYRYTISSTATVVVNGTPQPINSASVVLSLSDFTPLPKPALVQPVQQQKRQVTLSWDSEQYQAVYGSYDIERATNLTGTFRRLNELPYVQLADSSQYLYYADSLPNQTRIYQYRIIGRSYFDEAQTSDPVAVTIVQEQQSIPSINSIRSTSSQYTINWRYPLEGTNSRLDTLISQFTISVSNHDTTAFKAVGSAINYALTTTTLPAATVAALVDTTKSYYFRISAIGISGDIAHSLPYLVSPQDKTPPATPNGVLVTDLSATVSGTNSHLIRIEWQPNTENDLLGYQVFRQIGNETEKIDVSGGIHIPLFIVDTLSRNIAVPDVTYFVWAYDQNYHRSIAAGIGRFTQPDVTAPMPPLLTGYSKSNAGITLTWELSPSSKMEVIHHDLLRKEVNGVGDWQVIWSSVAGDTIRRFTDESVQTGTTYVYSLVAYDETGNASCFKRNPVTAADCYQLLLVNVSANEQLSPIQSFTAVYDTLTNRVNLGWQYNQPGVQTYEVYKARAAFKPSGWKTLDSSVLTATDTDIDSGLTYVYQLRAVFTNGTSTPWAPVTVTCRQNTSSTQNQLPQLTLPITPQLAVVGTPFSYTLPANTFTDPDGQLISVLFAGNFPPGLIAQNTRILGTPTQPGSYTLAAVATDDRNGQIQSPLVITVESILASPTIYGIGTICSGQSTTLTASNCAGTIQWSSGAIGATIIVTPQQSVSYTATCQTGSQTSKPSSPFQITVIPTLQAPALVATQQNLCLDESATLTASNCPGELHWSVGHTAPQLTVSPTATTIYSATCILASCVSPAGSITIIVNTPPSLTILGNQTPCFGQATTLLAQAPSATSYRWSTGATTASLSTTTNGVYSVTVTNGAGCVQSDSMQITTLRALTATIAGATTICAGAQTTLTAYGGQGYTWSTGAITPSISISAAGPYSVTVSNNTGCTASTTVNVVSATVAIPTILATATDITAGQSVTLSASGCNGIVTWFNSSTAIGTGQTFVLTPVASASYTSRCSLNTCISNLSTPIAIQVSNAPQPPILSASSSTICSGQSVTLTASNCAGTVTWSTGNTGSILTVTPANTTSYTATCTVNSHVSGSSNSLSISVNALPTASIGGSLTICSGQVTTLTASGGNIYKWNTGATTASITTNTAGTYSVTTTSGTNCSAVANATVVINAAPTASIAGNLTICSGQNTTLTASGGSTYQWNTGVTTSSITVSTAGTYSVTATSGASCSAVVSRTVVVNALPTAAIAGNLSICSGQTTTLTASGGSTYKWNTGATTASITTSTAGTYSVTVTNGSGCSAVTSATLSVLNPAITSISVSSTAINVGQSVTLTANGCSGTVNWSTGSTGSVLVATPTASTSYSATCTLGSCSSSAVSPLITVNRPPVVQTAIASQTVVANQAYSYTIAANTFSDPDGQALTLTAAGLASGLSFNGSTRIISGVPTTAGSYTITIMATDPGSLSVSTSFVLTVTPATFAMTGVTMVNCQTISAGQRTIQFSPQYVGVNGQPISFSVVNEMAPTTSPGPYSLTFYTDNATITLKAIQSGVPTTYVYNWLAACNGTSTSNQAPTVASSIPSQTAAVGQSFTFGIPGNTFADDGGVGNLTLSVSGLPAGLSFTSSTRTISGFPSASGNSTITVTATDAGNLAISTTFVLSVNASSASFAITGATMINCQTISAGQRSITFNPQYVGLTGQPVTFSIVNEMAGTTNPGPYTRSFYTDDPTITLRAVQNGVTSNFVYNWLAACP